MKKIAALLLALALSACSMAESKLIDSTMDMSCTLDGGTYYLPRTMVHIVVNEVTKDPNATGPSTANGTEYVIQEITSSVQQDRRYSYCLDFLASPTSEDTFVVSRNDNLLLTKVTSRAEDKSKEIAKTLIQAIFVGLSGDPQFGTERSAGGTPLLGKTKRFEVEYDPFDDDQADLINESLKDYGYCLVLENARFLARQVSPEQYCDQPLAGGKRERRLTKASTDKFVYTPPAHSQGLFYRPRLPYSFNILQKDNLQARGGWHLLGSNSVLFENASPVFSVAVDRSYFTHRKTTIEFEAGALKDVSIDKGSEFLGFVEIPLTIAQSVAALPSSILQVKIDSTNNRANLIRAQKELLDSHRTYLESLDAYKKLDAESPVKTANIKPDEKLPFRSGGAGKEDVAQSTPSSADTAKEYSACMADCSKDPSAGAQCQNYCQCRAVQCQSYGDETACDATCSGLKPKK